MSDQTMVFPFGTLVWVKVYNRIWWPGRVVDPKTVPHALQDYMLRKKNPIAMVFFECDEKYDIVININMIEMYSCERKMEFIKKGYSLYLKEKKGTKQQNLEMVNFIKDVIKFEKEINGDVNIFKQFEKEDLEHPPPPKELIKKLFVFGKNSDKKKCAPHKKPFVFGKSSDQTKCAPPPKKLFVFGKSSDQQKCAPPEEPSVFGKSSDQQKCAPRPEEPFVFGKSSDQKKCTKTHIPVSKNQKFSRNSQSSSSDFACPLNDSCNFTSTRSAALKRHMLLCKADVKVPTTKLESKVNSILETENKRNNETKRNSTKLKNEVLPQVNSNNCVNPENHHIGEVASKQVFTTSSVQNIINPLIESLSIQVKEPNPSCSTDVVSETVEFIDSLYKKSNEEREAKHLFINNIIMNGDEIPDFYLNNKVDSKKDGTKTDQFPSDFEKYTNKERKLSMEKSATVLETEPTIICGEIDDDYPMGIFPEINSTARNSPDILIARKTILIHPVFPEADDDEDIQNLKNSSNCLMGKFWLKDCDPDSDKTCD